MDKVDKLHLFLIGDGIVVLLGALFFIFLYLRKRNESNFRDDIWKTKAAKQEAETKRRLETKQSHEDQVDKKILLEHRPDPRGVKETEEHKPFEKPPFRVPNFRGKPHDILGISENADADTVAKAHKYWIKRYHPDRVTHLGGKYIEQARVRAEQLNAARNQLLAKFSKK